jgi:hypothetical protein|tara:strand:- start:812 stop:1033 length:222 start_codon:yes stop_codon:yes gene_type:complete
MQQVDLTQFPNSSGWHVIHDPTTLMYIIKNSNGNKRQGQFTHRRMAEVALQGYLELLAAPKKPAGRPKKDVNS